MGDLGTLMFEKRKWQEKLSSIGYQGCKEMLFIVRGSLAEVAGSLMLTKAEERLRSSQNRGQ